MSEHYHVLVPGESGHEFPLFSVGCICGDMECPETGRDTPWAEQRAVKEWAESAQAAELTALRALCESLKMQRDEALGTVSLLKELNETLRGERDRENAELITASAQLSEALAVIARAVEWAEESVICRSEEADFGWHGACHGVLSILRGTNAQS